MCVACYDEFWAAHAENGETIEEWMNRQGPASWEAIARAVSLIRAHPGMIYTGAEPVMVAGPLHVAVEDENYGSTAGWRVVPSDDPWASLWEDWGRQGYLGPITEAACHAWDALNEEQRSFVCRIIWGRP